MKTTDAAALVASVDATALCAGKCMLAKFGANSLHVYKRWGSRSVKSNSWLHLN